MGAVYWITGLAGAGKTTIGKAFFERLRQKYINAVFLDGDTMRKIFCDDLGYTQEERRKCAMRYAKLCALLEMQDIKVVCCTISMFDSVREWNRKNIPNYYEIYIKASMGTLINRNQKGLYSSSSEGRSKDVAGISFTVEEPKNPDLVLENEGNRTAEELADYIVNEIGLV